MREPILEPLIRKMRLARVLSVLRRFPQGRLLDIGCSWAARFLPDVEPYIARGVDIGLKAPFVASPESRAALRCAKCAIVL